MAGLEERVRLVAWAPQQEVLRHRAVGCFITHSGWNSTLESAATGVSMVCWPWEWDQLVNSRLVGEVWKGCVQEGDGGEYGEGGDGRGEGGGAPAKGYGDGG
ncbi:hypothetical protein M5K25_013325 [Dendrobium thyrsiflorum]|uniref:Uncharacterized protein n=1 Tax=Dendrobium thyrsiflorum TaxID=117978 RepID=A0ABD0USX0_DENTH